MDGSKVVFRTEMGNRASSSGRVKLKRFIAVEAASTGIGYLRGQG
jgi:hypothetical protein